MNNNSYIITGKGMSIVIDGKPYTVDDTNPNYTAIKTAVKAGHWNDIPDLINLSKIVKNFVVSNPDIFVDETRATISYKGQTIHNSLVKRIFDMMEDGFSVVPMTNLLVNLYHNVSMKAIDELYGFLEYGKMPITEDGHFLAYKRVNDDYTSCYDHKTENNIGHITWLPRNQVDDRSEVTCSYGLHICSFEYLQHYPGARVIVVKVNPADVVSIPTDYNNTKARVCRYEVIGELTFEEAGLTSHSFGTSVFTDYDQFDDEENDDSEIKLEMDDGEVSPDLVNFALNESEQEDLTIAILKKVLKSDVSLTDPEQETVNTQTDASQWFKVGYTNGYADGNVRVDKARDCELEDDDTGEMTQQDIDKVNAGYTIGYKDGRGHKTRRYPKTSALSAQ